MATFAALSLRASRAATACCREGSTRAAAAKGARSEAHASVHAYAQLKIASSRDIGMPRVTPSGALGSGPTAVG